MIVHIESKRWGEHWNMTINLDEIIKDETFTYYDKKEKKHYKERHYYPVSKARQLFKIMVENIENDAELDEIQQFFDEKHHKFAGIFKEIRQKRK